MKKYLAIVALLIACLSVSVEAQRSKGTSDVYVDNQGVMRWGKTGEEVYGFGVNYTVPFAHAFQVAKQLNVPIEKAIDDDVYHFARLGFDLYRVHVWDTEISDTVGNLLDNEHLRLFDYAIMKMKERGMKFMITPIAYWGNGWPAPDQKTPGFAAKYGKDNCLTNPDAIKAQEKYLNQFLNHVNPYTKLAYKNDPDVIGFEVSNEPHHRGTVAEVTTFINRMVKSMRATGCKKPILYNITHSIHLADAYFNSNIQGGTYQWYPTGLGFRHELGGNLLPNVDRYSIPFASHPKFKQMAKVVYEFDAADVGRSYMYPAMARSFREAGMQIATHFSYEPTYMAYANTEYGTHYVNLVYAPQKALSLKIAGEVFHRVPRYQSFGKHPGNTTFGEFKVNYGKDLAEMITNEKFIYTNHTASKPNAIEKLNHVAGWGNSPVVQYEGTGAYFLDKISDGVWRLEVLPDAIWVEDPFTRTSLKKEIAVINWRTWPMSIALPTLGEDFQITALNEGNTYSTEAKAGSFMVSPGTYVLKKAGLMVKLDPVAKLGAIKLNEFVSPATTLTRNYVLHKPATQLSAGVAHTIEATIITRSAPEVVELHVWSGFRSEIIPMQKKSGYTYTATIPATTLREGYVNYYIAVKENGKYVTYPDGNPTNPRDWDFYSLNSYKVSVVAPSNPIYLFTAFSDADELVRQWIRGLALVPLAEPNKAEFQINVEKLFVPDPENPEGKKVYDYSARYFFGNKIEGRSTDLATMKSLVLSGRALNDKPCKLQVALVLKDGTSYGATLPIGVEQKEYTIALGDLKRVNTVTLPRPYPTFLPYYFDSTSSSAFDIAQAESLQISIGPGLSDVEANEKQGVAIESIKLK
jgi:hypothetical protein